MRHAVTISTFVIAACCAAALAYTASVWPFAFGGCIVFLVGMVVAALALPIACVCLLVGTMSGPSEQRTFARRHALVAAILVVFTGSAIATAFPRRIAFACSRDELDRLARSLKSATAARGPAAFSVGPYHVDEYAVDASGGMYFRVGSSSLVDVTSWGFCIRPHPKTTPFGAAGYETTSLGGGWYWLEANDDWY